MRLIPFTSMAAAISLSPLALSTSSIIIPRKASPDEVAFHAQIAPFQAPLYRHQKSTPYSFTLTSRDGKDPRIYGMNKTSTLTDLPLSSANIPRIPNDSFRQNLTFINGQIYYLPVTIGEQVVNLTIDTGSSDTWVIKSGFECTSAAPFNTANEYYSRRWDCAFGHEFDPDLSPSFQYINQANGSFMVIYADNTYAEGFIGRDTLNVSGIIVNQTIGVVNRARWGGDNATSGLLGLGYPGSIPSTPGHRPYDWITQAENEGDDDPRGPIPAETDQGTNFDCHDTYPPFIQSFVEGGYDPVFSVNLLETRNDVRGHGPKPQNGGFIAFGGIPYAEHLGLPFAKAKMNPDFNESTCPSDIKKIGYGFEIDAVTDGSEIIASGKHLAKIDTGSSVMIFPRWLSKAFWQRVDPVPWMPYPVLGRRWQVWCNATLPDLGFVIGGVVIKLDRNQLIAEEVSEYGRKVPDSERMCKMNIITNFWTEELILGVPFLHGALVVYDLGKKEIRIAKKFAADPFHIPDWSDRQSSKKVMDHPPLGGKSTAGYINRESTTSIIEGSTLSTVDIISAYSVSTASSRATATVPDITRIPAHE
ncbi:hypothetical protein TWF730_005021 [Orbilia blumenaviensis]|uniref:Peptidase A1 domain-containing protein n=1 Tax=Orbilia blumenaviensis TaxID=1796055 RepID=A0AAV9VH10_9PEZI